MKCFTFGPNSLLIFFYIGYNTVVLSFITATTDLSVLIMATIYKKIDTNHKSL